MITPRHEDERRERIAAGLRQWAEFGYGVEASRLMRDAADLLSAAPEVSPPRVFCRHCADEIRLLDSAWCDSETHSTCCDSERKHEPPDEQADDAAVVNAITAIVRDADRAFEKGGGGSRHWVRDWFLPYLNRAGWTLAQPSPAAHSPLTREQIADPAHMRGVAAHRPEPSAWRGLDGERLCLCADPENCTERVPGVVCRRDIGHPGNGTLADSSSARPEPPSRADVLPYTMQDVLDGTVASRSDAVGGLPQVAGRLDRTLADFERSCLVLMDDEQRKTNPDNALIAVLCDAVRLARESTPPLLADAGGGRAELQALYDATTWLISTLPVECRECPYRDALLEVTHRRDELSPCGRSGSPTRSRFGFARQFRAGLQQPAA